MQLSETSDQHPVIRKLANMIQLTDAERDAVLALPMQVERVESHRDIVRQGDRPTRCFALLEGIACTFKLLANGRRQIVMFHLPGDIPDLQSLHLHKLDVSVGTVTNCEVGFVEHEAVRSLCHQHPRLNSVLWRETLIDASIFREWVTNVGQRKADARISHLICETLTRFRAIGCAEEGECAFPMTQIEIGDATGMSAVHVNRALQGLRKRKLFTLKNGRLKILDWNGLVEVAGFDDDYLHLNSAD